MPELADWTRYIPDVLIGAFGLGIAWVLYHLFVTGPRQRREVLDGLAAFGYTPLPIDDPGLLAAIAQQAPHRVFEILERGAAPKLRCLRAMTRTAEGRTRYVMIVSRSYRYRETAQEAWANCDETLVVETMPTAVGPPFHVNTFAEEYTSTRQARVTAGLDEPFAGQFFVYSDDAAAVPPSLQSAFADVAPAFLGGIRPTASFPRQPLNTRFTGSGWALTCDPLMDPAQMAELLRVADRLSDGAAVSSAR